jgi:hypothetical protein
MSEQTTTINIGDTYVIQHANLEDGILYKCVDNVNWIIQFSDQLKYDKELEIGKKSTEYFLPLHADGEYTNKYYIVYKNVDGYSDICSYIKTSMDSNNKEKIRIGVNGNIYNGQNTLQKMIEILLHGIDNLRKVGLYVDTIIPEQILYNGEKIKFINAQEVFFITCEGLDNQIMKNKCFTNTKYKSNCTNNGYHSLGITILYLYFNVILPKRSSYVSTQPFADFCKLPDEEKIEKYNELMGSENKFLFNNDKYDITSFFTDNPSIKLPQPQIPAYVPRYGVPIFNKTGCYTEQCITNARNKAIKEELYIRYQLDSYDDKTREIVEKEMDSIYQKQKNFAFSVKNVNPNDYDIVKGELVKNKQGGSNKRYTIRRYTYGKARKLGVRVRPSTKKDKKLDVYRHNKKIASIGARGMGDYPTFRQTRGQTFANRRRRAYKIRHQRDRTKRWSRGWLADQLLW